MSRFTGLLLVCSACGPAIGGPPGSVDTFVAFATDFRGYMHWESHALRDAPVQGTTHAGGDRTVYLSRRPGGGATAFPVGTLIVKALPGVGQVFARVKRGGGFNADGASGWEWFELQHVSAEDVTIVWRGVGPPSSEQGYGGDPNGCNGCHLAARDNDFVSAPDLLLTRF